MPRIAVLDLGGSLNQGRPPSELAIAPGEYAAIKNFYQFGSKLRRRGGMRRLTTSAYSERITGLAFYNPTAPPPGGVDMIIGSLTSLAIFKGNGVTAIPNEAGFSIPTSTKRWTLFQYKNVMYGIRKSVGLIRTNGEYVGPTGLAAPTVAPTIADGAAGAIPAANFKAVYTFYNANTNLESNPSPVSNTLAHAVNTKINWTGIAVSANNQVTSRRIYRTLPDQSLEYFLVAEIANNTDTTYTGDNVLAESLDRAVSQVNGLPPVGLLFGAIWKERLFASDGTTLFHSEDGLIEAFDPDADIPISPDDGHAISAIHPFGDRLIIGKTNGIHYLSGSDPSSFAIPPIPFDRHGCVSHLSMQSSEGFLFWLGLDDVYRSDGNTVVGIASLKLRTLIEAMGSAALNDAVGTVLPRLGWYVLSIPGYAQLVYNYRTNVWTTMPTATDIQAVGDSHRHEDANTEHWINVADDAGHIYRFHDTTYGRDDTASVLGGTISAEFDGRAFGSEASTKHFVTKASLLAPRYPEQITLAIISEDVAIKSRTVSLDYEPRWKLYNLSTRHQAKSQSQLRVTYTGATAIELEGYALDIEPIGRSTMQAL